MRVRACARVWVCVYICARAPAHGRAYGCVHVLARVGVYVHACRRV